MSATELDQALQRLHAVAHSHGTLGAQPADLLMVVGALQPQVAAALAEPQLYWVQVYGPRLRSTSVFGEGQGYVVADPLVDVLEVDGCLEIVTAARDIEAPRCAGGHTVHRPSKTVHYAKGEWTHFEHGLVKKRASLT